MRVHRTAAVVDFGLERSASSLKYTAVHHMGVRWDASDHWGSENAPVAWCWWMVNEERVPWRSAERTSQLTASGRGKEQRVHVGETSEEEWWAYGSGQWTHEWRMDGTSRRMKRRMDETSGREKWRVGKPVDAGSGYEMREERQA